VRTLLITFGLWLFAVLIAMLLYTQLAPPFTSLTAWSKLTGRPVQQRWVDIDAISPALVRAVILSEDTGFCQHPGVSIGEIEKAMENAKDGVPRGASTISMQLTKNLFLWPQRSYIRKGLEIPLTLVLEQVMSKRRIMEIYLNVAQWGPGVFGAEAAARHHFGKPAARLTETEAALLAASLPAPVMRKPGRPSPLLQRLGTRLEARMRAVGSRVAGCVLAS
jgi:monofunctional biosynthetic peptidoglycan transglycosylase